MRRCIEFRWSAVLFAFLAMGTGNVEAGVFNFQVQDDRQAASFYLDGVSVWGSGTLAVNPMSGLNILGGLPNFSYRDGTIDETEWVMFQFDSGHATNLRLELSAIGGAGTTLLEAFDVAGASLGTREFNSVIPGSEHILSFSFDISSAFANAPISAFRLQPVVTPDHSNFLSIARLNFENNVPEPGSFALLGLATLAYGVGTARKRCRRS